NVCLGCTNYAAPMPLANLSILKDALTNCYLKDEWVVYEIIVTNAGPSTAYDVVIHDPIAPLYSTYGITYYNMTWEGTNGSAGTGTLNNTIDALNVGETVIYTLNIRIPETIDTTLNLTNRVYVSSSTPDPLPVLNNNPNNGFGQQMAVASITPCPNYVTITNTEHTADELVKDVLVGMDCALIENITSQGYPAGMGYFHANNSDFPLKEGVVLRCGPVLNTAGPFTTGGGDGVASGMGDADLQAISIANGQPNSINDVTFLQFDFTPINDQMSFNFVFASNEYASGFQCTFA